MEDIENSFITEEEFEDEEEKEEIEDLENLKGLNVDV